MALDLGDFSSFWGFSKQGISSESIPDFMAYFPLVTGFISASALQDINLSLALSEARDVALCKTESGSRPSGRIRPADITTLYFAARSRSKWGTSPGSTTVPLLRAPRASFFHSLIRLAGSPIWQPRAPIWQSALFFAAVQYLVLSGGNDLNVGQYGILLRWMVC